MVKKIRILIIDNEPRWLEFAQQDLITFEIVVAHNEQEAREQLEQDQFDLVVANASSMDILELIAAQYSEKKVVVTTVKPTTQEALRAYRSGALRYFSKSFGRQDLLKQVRDVLPGV